MTKKFYITTPIYYINGDPHVGSAYTTIAADVITRYKKSMGYETFFLTGLDEHGMKVEESAKKDGLTPQQLVDKMAPRFKSMWDVLNIEYSDFIRTTEERHKDTVKKIFKQSYDNGDIYKGEYEGLYCVSCETFVPESQAIDGNKCPDCKKELRVVKEESYFFKMSKYQDELLKHIENNPDFIQPDYRKNEVVSFIKQGLKDLSISRNTFKWGIPLEIDPSHVIYVWFDALTNYITAVGYNDNPDLFNKFWNDSEVVHLIGKDILRFHTVIWPTMLMSAGVKLPNKVFAHGWWTSEGQKMSKSFGNVVNPEEECKKFGRDAFRYFVMREVPFGLDGDYSQKAIISRINSDLANDIGNLLNRSIGMSKKYFDGVVTRGESDNHFDNIVKELFTTTLKEIDNEMNKLQFSRALETLWKFISRMNKYIDETMPWSLAKDEAKKARLNEVLYNLVESMYKISVLIYPFMPDTAQEILNQLNVDKKISDIKIEEIVEWGCYPSGTKLNDAKPLFPRIEIEEVKTEPVVKPEKTKEKKIEVPVALPEGIIAIDDFKKSKIQVVKILEAENVDGSDKLLKFKVSLGTEVRSVVSGIAKYYDPKTLIGKKVLMVTNLKPVMLKKVLSEGMLLSTSDNGVLKLIEIDEIVAEGSEVG